MRFRVTVTVLLGALALSAATAASPARASTADSFRSPTGNIGCYYSPRADNPDNRDLLRCDVVDGIVPLPPTPKGGCEYDWGAGYWLNDKGMANITCAGDTARGGKKIIPYGTTWKRGSFTCASSPNGFRCKNLDGHGFLISKGESYRF